MSWLKKILIATAQLWGRSSLFRWCLGLSWLAANLGIYALMGSSGLWLAMPQVLPFVAMWVAQSGIAYAFWYAAAILVVSAVWGAADARAARRDAERRQRDAYNDSLQDRMTTVMGSNAPWQIIYGQTWVVPVTMSDVLTSGDKDQFKHCVVIWAAHECTEILDFTLNGVSVGALDANGWVTSGKYTKENTGSDSVLVSFNEAGVGIVPVKLGSVMTVTEDNNDGPAVLRPGVDVTFTLLPDNTTQVTINPDIAYLWAGRRAHIAYETALAATSYLRVRHHLGSADQAADAALLADCPTVWKASDRLRGLCYSVITYDLNNPEFQGGPQAPRALIKGKAVYDWRTGTTAYKNNAALCAADYIRAEYGKNAAANQMVTASMVAAANDSDEPVMVRAYTPITGTFEFFVGPRYTINGAIRTDVDPDTILDQLCEAMGGTATRTGGMWTLQAGVYTPPVMDLTDADLLGAIDSVPGQAGHQVTNGLRGQFFDPLRYGESTDYPSYSNGALVTEDGVELWSNRSYPFTDTGWRIWQLARISVERSRGETLIYRARRRAVKLKPGQRVRVSSTKLGISQVVFRVVKKEWSIGKPVTLTLQQDAPDVYDMVDALASLPPTSTLLDDPWKVSPVAGLAALSGNSTLVKTADGTVLSRIKVTFAASTEALVVSNGALQLEYRREQDTAWLRAPDCNGGATEAYLQGLQEGRVYVIRARWCNSIGAVSDWRHASVLHLGKSEPPSAVVFGQVVVSPGKVRIHYTACPDLDYGFTRLSFGATWNTAVGLGQGGRTFFDWPLAPVGTHKLWAVHLDTSGNTSAPVSLDVEVTSAINLPSQILNPDPGWLNSNVVVGGRNLLVGASDGAGWNYSYRIGNEFQITRSSAGEAGYIYSGYITVPGSTEVTLTFESKQDGAVSGTPDWYLLPDNYAAIGLSNWTYPASTDWTKQTITFTTPAAWGTGASVRFRLDHNGSPGGASRTYFARKIKLELGNKATDWTPPVEDVAAASAAAKTAADAAATNASSALNRLASIDSDGILSRGEKPEIIKAWAVITGESGGIYTQAGALGIATERTAYSNAYDALSAYLSSLSPGYADTSQDTIIIPANDRAVWSNYYSARQTLLNKIAAVFGAAGGANMIWGATGTNAGPGTYGRTLTDLRTPSSNPFSLQPGEQLTISTDVWQDATSAAAGQYASVYLFCRDGAGSWTGYTVTVNSYGQTQAGSRASSTLTLPADAQMQYVTVAIYHQGGSTNLAGSVYCDRVKVERGPVATQYGPGAEPGATQNDVVYSGTAPSSPSARTLWIDTSVTPRTIRMFIGGSWVVAGTYVNGTAQLTDDAQLGLTALWSGVAGTGKPQDGATKNLVFYQDPNPGAQPDGTIWITSTKAYQRVNGNWQPYVGANSIDTVQIVNGAATDIYVATATDVQVTGLSGVPTGSFTDVHSVTFTARGSGIASVTADEAATFTSVNLFGGPPFISGGRTRFLVNGSPQGELARFGPEYNDQEPTAHKSSVVRTTHFAVVEGQTYTVKLQAQNDVFDQDMKFSGTLRIEVMKK